MRGVFILGVNHKTVYAWLAIRYLTIAKLLLRAYNEGMTEKYKQQLTELAEALVTADRFQEVQRVAELATVTALFPDLPQAAIHYFPERPGDLGA